MEYVKPKNLLVYYGWLNSFNSAVNAWSNEAVARDMAKYGLIVLGDGVQDPSHGDYANAQVIIPRIKELNPRCRIFGYVTVNQSQANFETKAAQWNVLGVHGIFMDEAGYDYGTVATNGRLAFNVKVDFVHKQGSANLCFANAWNMDHVIGVENDASYPNSTWNPSGYQSALVKEDWYLLESFPINTTAYSGAGNDGYESKTDWLTRGFKAINHRETYGINLAAVGVIANGHANGDDLFQFGFASACMFNLDAFGTSDTNYGASSSAVTWWTRPDVLGINLDYPESSIKVDVDDADVFWRFFECGNMMLNFSGSNNQDSSITNW